MKIGPITPPLYKKPTIYRKAAKYIAGHENVQKALQKFEANTGLYASVLAFIVGTTLKPATILAIPNDKDDNKYAVARSISTAMADLGLAVLVFIPLRKRLDLNARKLFDTPDSIYHKNPDVCTRFKSLYNRMFKLAFVPVFATAKFALINPIVKKLNKKETK